MSSPGIPEDFDEAASPIHVGDVISGKFRVDRILGEGGMGVVVAATHLQLDEPVALKFLRRQFLKSGEATARFSQEARTASKLKSEHVARVLDVSALDDGTPYIVMEYLRGQDLRQLLNQAGRLDVETAVEYAVQTCEGLAEAHARGIIHRDIKPENLFLVERSQSWHVVKILDFGISKAAIGSAGGSNVRTGSIMGSPCYMSPEQLRETSSVDLRTDIWALGAVLYELLTGKTAFDGSMTLTNLILTIIEKPPPLLRTERPDVPEGLEAIVVKCLTKDRDLRFANTAELAIALLPFAPKRSRVSAERATSVTREAGLSAPDLSLPPSIVPPPLANEGLAHTSLALGQHTVPLSSQNIITDTASSRSVRIVPKGGSPSSAISSASIGEPVVHGAAPTIPAPAPANTKRTPIYAAIVAGLAAIGIVLWLTAGSRGTGATQAGSLPPAETLSPAKADLISPLPSHQTTTTPTTVTTNAPPTAAPSARVVAIVPAVSSSAPTGKIPHGSRAVPPKAGTDPDLDIRMQR